jgi:hypothetical protein
METIKQHFIDWGAFYQTIVAIIFGLISVMLWLQDRKKSHLIVELQRQTKLLTQQLQHFINLDKPCLSVTGHKYWMDAFDTTIENSGSDIYSLSFNNVSDTGTFEIQILNKPEKLATKNSFSFRYKQIKDKNTLETDTLTFHFKDKYDRIYSQELVLMFRDNSINFLPSTIDT